MPQREGYVCPDHPDRLLEHRENDLGVWRCHHHDHDDDDDNDDNDD